MRINWKTRFHRAHLPGIFLLLVGMITLPREIAAGQPVPFDWPYLRIWLFRDRYQWPVYSVRGVWPPTDLAISGWKGGAEEEFQRKGHPGHPGDAASSSEKPTDFTQIGLRQYSGYREGSSSRYGTFEAFVMTRWSVSSSLSAFMRSRATGNPEGLPEFTGRRMSIARGPFIAAETDYMFFRLHGRPGYLDVGRVRLGWTTEGPHSMLISAEGPPIDGFSGSLRYHDFYLYFFSGYLESLQSRNEALPVHRYLSGHYLLFHRQYILVTLGETLLYAGAARPFDFSYAIPLTTFFESDANHRFNQPGNEIDNTFVHFSVKYYWPGKLSLYGAVLADELQIDPKDRRKEPDALAWRIASDVRLLSRRRFLSGVHLEYVKIGTWTYRYENGLGNYIARGLPIGWWRGSDLSFYLAELEGLVEENTLLGLSIRHIAQGAQNILEHPFEPKQAIKVRAPSGSIHASDQFLLHMTAYAGRGFWLGADLGVSFVRSVSGGVEVKSVEWLFGGSLYWSLGFSLYGRKGN